MRTHRFVDVGPESNRPHTHLPPPPFSQLLRRAQISAYRSQHANNRTYLSCLPSQAHPHAARRLFASPLSTGPSRDRGALHRHRHASATTLRFISLSPRATRVRAVPFWHGALSRRANLAAGHHLGSQHYSTWPEEQSRSGCGQDGGDEDQPQHSRMWLCRSSCPLLLARPSPPRQPPCSQPPPSPRCSIVRGGRWERGAWGFLSPRGCSRVWGACFRRVGVASGGGNSWPRGNPEAERGRSNAQARLPIESATTAPPPHPPKGRWLVASSGLPVGAPPPTSTYR